MTRREVFGSALAGAVASGLLLTGCGKKDGASSAVQGKVVDPSAQKANMVGSAKSRQGQVQGAPSGAKGPAGGSSKSTQ